MRQQEPSWLAIVVCAVIAWALLSLLWADHAQCQDRLSQADRLDIMRCLCAEAAPGPDALPILAVLASRSSSLGWSARHYCALFVARHPSARQAGIRLLPGGPLARMYRVNWRRAGEALDAFLAGARPDCHPFAFGDHQGDARRARRMGWVREDCGHTQSAFWRRPVVLARYARGRR